MAIGPDTTPAQALELVNFTEALRADAERLLKEGRVKLVIGYRSKGAARPPVFISDPAKTSALVFDELCAKNLASYLHKPELRKKFPIAVVAPPAVCRSLILLAAEAQLGANDVVVFACGPREYHGALDLAGTSKLLKEKYPDLAPAKELLEAVAELDKMTAEERARFWSAQFLKCTRCYACRSACPACYCKRCIVEKNVPQWISAMADGHGNYAWNIIRAFHLAGRCTLCGSCEAACPQGIPLMLFNAKVDSIVLEEFKAKAGYDTAEKPFIGSWSPDDDNKFIK